MARRLHMSREKLRLIAPVGAAAGLAAAFNAPITAVLFVIEEVIGRWTAGILGRSCWPQFPAPSCRAGFSATSRCSEFRAYHLEHVGELAAYAVLGVIGGLASIIFIKYIAYLRPRLRRLPAWTHWFQPAVAGLIIGVIGICYPQIMGAGYTYIDQAMHEQFTWQVLLILGGLKIFGTGLSFSSGTPGGLFAPVLFMGAMIGGAVGMVEQHLFPYLAIPVGAYALVGMGTLFAGILRAPMTSVFMMLEVSGNYTIIVPVIISNAIAYVISRSFEPTPVFDLLSRQDGMDLPSLEEEREMPLLRVEDAMRPAVGQVLTRNMSVHQALQQVKGSSQEFFVVGMGGTDWRGCQPGELLAMPDSNQPLRSVLLHHIPYVHPDFTLDTALRIIGQWPIVPVVHRADFQQLLGVLSLDDIVRAYRGAGLSEDIEEEEPHVRSRDLSRCQFTKAWRKIGSSGSVACCDASYSQPAACPQLLTLVPSCYAFTAKNCGERLSNELDRLRPLWNELFRHSPKTMFQSFEWNRLAAEVFGDRLSPAVCAVESDSGAAIIPGGDQSAGESA